MEKCSLDISTAKIFVRFLNRCVVHSVLTCEAGRFVVLKATFRDIWRRWASGPLKAQTILRDQLLDAAFIHRHQLKRQQQPSGFISKSYEVHVFLIYKKITFTAHDMLYKCPSAVYKRYYPAAFGCIPSPAHLSSAKAWWWAINLIQMCWEKDASKSNRIAVQDDLRQSVEPVSRKVIIPLLPALGLTGQVGAPDQMQANINNNKSRKFCSSGAFLLHHYYNVKVKRCQQ